MDSAEDWLKLDELCFEEFELDWLEGELPQEAKARTETTRGRNFLVFMPLMLMPKRRIKKTALWRPSLRFILLTLGLGELLVEAVDTSVLSDETLLASVEGVAIAAGVNLDFGKD